MIVWLETLYPPAMGVILGVTVLPFTFITILSGLTPDALSVMFTLMSGVLSEAEVLFAGTSPEAYGGMVSFMVIMTVCCVPLLPAVSLYCMV